jgi:hypothetical protein
MTQELCVMESSRIPLPDNRISAIFLYIKKYKDSNTLLNALARKEHFRFLA